MEIDKHDENTKKRKRELDTLEDVYLTVGMVFDEILFKESLKHPRIRDRVSHCFIEFSFTFYPDEFMINVISLL